VCVEEECAFNDVHRNRVLTGDLLEELEASAWADFSRVQIDNETFKGKSHEPFDLRHQRTRS
jgi:hypothetical protein